jgi:protein involved in polysaccharide export with SLBB domain
MVSMSAHRPGWLLRQGGNIARGRIIGRLSCSVIFFATFAPIGAVAQGSPGPLVSRSELVAAATQAEVGATKGDYTERARSAMLATSIRQRLRDGDVQVGDRVVVMIISDTVHRDTIVVRSGRFLELPGMIIVPVSGVLHSELQDRVSTEVLKYVKAQRIEVTPLMRVGVLGAVGRPGYFPFASDLTLSDAIMGAGGLTGTADVRRSIVRRGNQEYRSADETRKAISGGLTLDQFGLSAGDELVIGQQREFNAAAFFAMAGGLASLLIVFGVVHRR